MLCAPARSLAKESCTGATGDDLAPIAHSHLDAIRVDAGHLRDRREIHDV
jgi:hypothetical protein